MKFFQIARQRRGQALIIVAFSMISLFGFFALVLDVGLAYYLHQRMQSAADFAALCGASGLPNSTTATNLARQFAQYNGFVHNQEQTTVDVAVDVNASRVAVTITKPYQCMIASIVGVKQFNVGAFARAEFVALAPMNIDGSNDQMANIQSLGLFGPFAIRGNGDPFSVRYLNNGQSNPQYNADGWNFNISVPLGFTGPLKFAIFDPDTQNAGNAADPSATALDEIRGTPAYPAGSPGAIAKGGSHNDRTTTVYKLYKPDNTPTNLSDDVLVATYTIRDAVFSGPGQTDMTWVTPDGFQFDVATHGTGTYRLNVQTTTGSSENGFKLRAGSPNMNFANPTLTPAYQPLVIDAPGYLPLNLNTGGNITPTLGTLPPNPNGPMVVHINKFDTEGSGTIKFNIPGLGLVNGTRAGGDAFAEDTYTIPQGGAGGQIVAQYNGNQQDTSMWAMWYSGGTPIGQQRARLVE